MLRSKPVIGYLHTGMEKTGEELTYVQGATNVTRMDYLSPLFNELVFSLAVEKLLGIEIPPRATWIRMLMCRAQPHLLAPACGWPPTAWTSASTTMMIFGLREREMVLRLLREDHRPADEPQLHPPRRRGRRPARRLGGRRRRPSSTRSTRASTSTTSCSPASRSSASGPRASASSPPRRPWRCRRTGPILRSTGVAWDLRRDDALPRLRRGRLRRHRRHRTATASTATPIRLNEIRESMRIVRQMPRADARRATTGSRTRRSPRRRGPASTSRWRRSSTTSSSSPRASRSPRARSTSAVESPRGELGCYLVVRRLGPSRTACTSARPSFVNLQAVPR